MNASAYRSRHSGQVDDEVSDLSEEIILVGIPVGSCIIIGIRVDHCNTLERRRCLYGRNGNSVADELSIIHLYDRFADEIGSGGKVNQRGRDRRRITAPTASVPAGDGIVDCISIIVLAISFKRCQSRASKCSDEEIL